MSGVRTKRVGTIHASINRTLSDKKKIGKGAPHKLVITIIMVVPSVEINEEYA